MSNLVVGVLTVVATLSFTVTFVAFFFLRGKATNADIAGVFVHMEDGKEPAEHFLGIELRKQFSKKSALTSLEGAITKVNESINQYQDPEDDI